MAFDLVDREEEQRHPQRRQRMDDERVDERRDRPQPRPEVRDQLGDRNPRAEHERVLLPMRQGADHAQHPEADAGARADDQRHEGLALHVAHERALHAHEQRVRTRMRREPPVAGHDSPPPLPPLRQLGDLLDETCRDPVPAHDLAHRGLALDAAEQVVFLAGQHAALRGAACDT